MILGYARVVTIGSLVLGVVCVGVLHVVRTDLHPLSHRMSEYAMGSYGWIMTAAFVALACGLVAHAIEFRASPTEARAITRILTGIALVAATGTLASAVFKTGADQSDAIHSGASTIAVVGLVILALTHSLASFSRGTSVTYDRPAMAMALAAAFLAAASPILHETGWTGLVQRLLWVALIAWLLRVAWHGPRR